MTEEEKELLIEAVATANRPRPLVTLRYHPAWHDLDAVGREKAADLARALRKIEAALHPEGLSTTARAVLDRI